MRKKGLHLVCIVCSIVGRGRQEVGTKGIHVAEREETRRSGMWENSGGESFMSGACLHSIYSSDLMRRVLLNSLAPWTIPLELVLISR